MQGFDDYLRSGSVSPWAAVEGWNLQTCFHDPMHNLFLGTCRDLYSSSLGFWCRNGFFGSGTLDDKLAQFSKQLKESCRQEKTLWFPYDKKWIIFVRHLVVPDSIWVKAVSSNLYFLLSRSKHPRIGSSFKKFTAANTGLDTKSQFPELSSVYKAAFLKSSLWYFAKAAFEICEKFPDVT